MASSPALLGLPQRSELVAVSGTSPLSSYEVPRNWIQTKSSLQANEDGGLEVFKVGKVGGNERISGVSISLPYLQCYKLEFRVCDFLVKSSQFHCPHITAFVPENDRKIPRK